MCAAPQVPESWAAKAYPSLKPLSAWVIDLLERAAFIAGWVRDGVPAVLWISGFFFPQVRLFSCTRADPWPLAWPKVQANILHSPQTTQ